MPGYSVDVDPTVKMAAAMDDVATCSDNAKKQLDEVPHLGATAAGDGIGAGLRSFVQAWQTVMPQLSTEVRELGAKASGVKRVVVAVEQDLQGKFEAFSR